MGHRHTTSVDDILFEDDLDFNVVFVVNGIVEKVSVVVDAFVVSKVDKVVVEVASVVAAEDVEVVAKLVIVEVEVDDVVAKVVKVICGLVGKFIVVESIVWLDFIVVCSDVEDKVLLIGPAVLTTSVKKSSLLKMWLTHCSTFFRHCLQGSYLRASSCLFGHISWLFWSLPEAPIGKAVVLKALKNTTGGNTKAASY